MQASGRGFNDTAILQFTSDWAVILLNSAADEDALEKTLQALIGRKRKRLRGEGSPHTLHSMYWTANI
jgi:hypothetical protein